MTDVVDSLERVEQHDRVTVELADGRAVTGRAAPVTFNPNERLRIELRPDDGDERYELAASVDDGEWTPVRVRRQESDEEWEEVGEVAAVTSDEPGEQFDDAPSGDEG